MAVGMTLNQLYAPPSASAAPASATLTPPQGRSPKSQEDVKASGNMYQMPYPAQYSPQYPPATSTSMQYQPLTKPGPSTSEDYAADPLPFEYSRKSHRDDVLRSTSYNDSYGSQGYASSQRLSPYGQYPEPRSFHHSELSHGPQPPFPRSTGSQMYNPMPGSMLPLPNHQFPPLLDNPKKEVDAYPQPQYEVRGNTGTAQEAMIKVKTPLKLKYWRNGRRNLQCFPSCKVFGDYSAIKIEDLKQHDFMWGKCRGSLVTEVTLNSNVTFDDLILLGRVHSLENIPVAFEEAVIRECMLGRTIETEEMDAMKDQWITGERLPDFVQQDSNIACFEFKPKVWKYTEDMAQGKCKRRNVKYYVQFEAFVQMVAGDRRYYACIGSGMSTSFEVGSSRVLARQKRKAATSAADAAKKNPQTDMTSMQTGQAQQLMTDI
ncbi:Transmembrane protein [Phytophthora palmivora]|uniref:Transmembrane protein n=1 Tax=Phytophthora palmivora TaxID=4796 RepID=A0A2P4XEG1_9STRA|nr:Transmembrane protein [Phytophthora palmivora]